MWFDAIYFSLTFSPSHLNIYMGTWLKSIFIEIRFSWTFYFWINCKEKNIINMYVKEDISYDYGSNNDTVCNSLHLHSSHSTKYFGLVFK